MSPTVVFLSGLVCGFLTAAVIAAVLISYIVHTMKKWEEHESQAADLGPH